MKNYFYLFLLLAVLNSGCSESPQQALMDKKWYSGKGDYIEFKSDMTLIMKFENHCEFEHKFEFKSDHSILVIAGKENTGSESASFYIKDSVLLLVSHKNEKEDSTFYHLNEKYEKWQSKQIFIHGKVMTKEEPVPYLKFEF